MNHGRRALVVVVIASVMPLVACHRTSSDSASDAGPILPAITSSTKPAHATPVPLASVEAVVNPAHLPPYTGPTGSIEGTIRIDGPPAPDAPKLDFATCPDGAAAYAKLFREGPPGADGKRPLADAIVTAVGYEGFIPERRDAVRITATGCGLDARTYAVTFGQRIEFVNKSSSYWAPQLEGAESPALMLAPPNGDPVKLYPPKPGRFSLKEPMKHPYVDADVYVVMQPLHDVSDVAGHYRIDGVPVGKAHVGARLPVTASQTDVDVDVEAGAVKRVDLVLHYVPRVDALPLATSTSTAHVDGGRPYTPPR